MAIQHSKADASDSELGLSRRQFMKASLAAGLGLAVSPFLFPKPKAWAAGIAKTRFVVGSDVHINNYNSSTKLANAIAWGEGLSPKPDRYVFVGDIVDNGTLDQYAQLKNVLAASPAGAYDGGRYIFCQGNHETYEPGVAAAPQRFLEQLGQEQNKLLAVNGIPVITMGPNTNGDGYYAANEGFLADAYAQIEENVDGQFAAGAPIFIFCHHSIPNTAYTSEEWKGTYSQGMLDLMAAHPQTIHISGHSHATMEDPRSIDQSLGFTCIQDATLGAYFENERNAPHTMYDPESGSVSSYPAFNGEASQCLIVDIMENGTVELQRWNLYPMMSGANNSQPYQLYETWVLDIPGLISGTPTYAYPKTRKGTKTPQLPATGELAVAKAGMETLTVTFPSFTPGSDENLDMIHDYQLMLTKLDENGDATDTVIERRVFNDYYRSPELRHDATGELWSVLVSGLETETSYSIEVYANTSFADNGEPGTSKALGPVIAKTAGLSDAPRAILDIDYRTGSVKDAMGHEETLFGGSELAIDETLVAGSAVTVLKLDGNGGYGYQLSSDDYAFFTGQSTTECLFKMPDVQTDQCVFSNQQSAGSGFEIYRGELQFWFNHEGGRAMPLTDIRANEWVHAIAAFDGSTIKLYVNGELVDEANASKMTVPNPKRYIVGSDVSTSNNGGEEYNCAAGTLVAFARLYPRCFTADEVAAAFADTQATTKNVVDEATGVAVAGVGLAQTPVVKNTFDAPKATLGKNDKLAASFDVTLIDAAGAAQQPVSPLTLTLPTEKGFAGMTVWADVFHSDGTKQTIEKLTVTDDNRVVIENVTKLSQFDVVATFAEEKPGGDPVDPDNPNAGGQGGSGDGNGGSGSGNGNGGSGSGNGGSGDKGTGSDTFAKTGDNSMAGVVAGVAGVAGAAAAAAYVIREKLGDEAIKE